MISGLGLYLASLIFICYLTFSLKHSTMNSATWSALFWLTILFAVINSVAKSFIGEKSGVLLYYYQVASPQQIIISKTLYNILLCLIVSVTGYLLFSVLIFDPIVDKVVFFATLILASTGFSMSLTFISGISSKANNSNVLMAVLSLPLMISILLMVIRATQNSIDGLDRSASYDELINLVAINCISGSLSYVLFPYIWRS